MNTTVHAQPQQVSEKQAEGFGAALKSERGAVLVLTVVLSAVALAVMVTMLYVVTIGTSATSGPRKIRTSCEAALGAWEVMKKIIDTQGSLSGLSTFQSSLYTAGLQPYFNLNLPCQSADGLVKTFIPTKLKSGTDKWQGCLETLAIDPANNLTYDLYLLMGTDVQFNVYGKITYTGMGNTVDPSVGETGGTSGHLDTSGGVIPKSLRAEVQSVPSLLNVAIIASNTVNAGERCQVSVVYAY